MTLTLVSNNANPRSLDFRSAVAEMLRRAADAIEQSPETEQYAVRSALLVIEAQDGAITPATAGDLDNIRAIGLAYAAAQEISMPVFVDAD